jgi:hypothetical protein
MAISIYDSVKYLYSFSTSQYLIHKLHRSHSWYRQYRNKCGSDTEVTGMVIAVGGIAAALYRQAGRQTDRQTDSLSVLFSFSPLSVSLSLSIPLLGLYPQSFLCC